LIHSSLLVEKRSALPFCANLDWPKFSWFRACGTNPETAQAQACKTNPETSSCRVSQNPADFARAVQTKKYSRAKPSLATAKRMAVSRASRKFLPDAMPPGRCQVVPHFRHGGARLDFSWAPGRSGPGCLPDPPGQPGS